MKLTTLLGCGIFAALIGATAAASAQPSFEPFAFSRDSPFKPVPGVSIGNGEAIIDGYRFDASPPFPLRPDEGGADATSDGRLTIGWFGSGSLSVAFAWSERLNQANRETHWPHHRGFVHLPASPVTTWTAIASGLPAPPPLWVPRGRGPVPIDAWIMQADALRRGAN